MGITIGHMMANVTNLRWKGQETPQPQVNPNTVFHFANDTSAEYNIQGELTTNILTELGMKSNYSTWTSQLTSVEIGSNVTSIGHNVFYDCPTLTTVTMADTVLTIGDRVFFDCDNLASITLSNQLTSMGKENFRWVSLTSITFPATLNSLGTNVFGGTNTLTSVTFEGKTTTQVQGMSNYSWGIRSGCVITCSNGTITV